MRNKLLSLLLMLLLAALPALAEAADLPGLTHTQTLPLTYADHFSVDLYEGGYALIRIVEGDTLLVVPEGGTVPDGLSPDILVLQKPLDRIYLAATGAMALFTAADALGSVRMSALAAEDWYVAEATQAMQRGDIVYGGKYSQPDYELLIREQCDLAIENTMIYHTPKVQEMLLTLGIPVLVERSSYESHPLGRTEWIKLYGVLTDHLPEATAFFDEQAALVEQLGALDSTGKTVAFFYINDSGSAVVRSASDTVAQMIGLAGGIYLAMDEATEGSTRTNTEITMEQFYAGAMDADILIYNGSIDGVASINDMLARSPLLADFKAVQQGNVWGCTRHLYQATASVGTQVTELHSILTGTKEDQSFFYKLK